VTPEEWKRQVVVIEKGYEFFLAYAAQGVEGDSSLSGELRRYLNQVHEALGALEEGLGEIAEGLDSASAFASMSEVMRRDARDTKAAVGLVMAQTSVSSQLIDNLNASHHFRALLTDLFLIDEALTETLASEN